MHIRLYTRLYIYIGHAHKIGVDKIAQIVDLHAENMATTWFRIFCTPEGYLTSMEWDRGMFAAGNPLLW